MKLVFQIFKLCLFTFNTLYFLVGIGLLIGSTFIYLNPNQLNDYFKLEYGNEYLQLIYFFNGFGIFLILVGFLGCTGILSEKIWIIFIYFSFLFAIFAFQFIGSVILYIKSVNYFQNFATRILNAIKFEYVESGVHARAIDYMHSQFKCCGWYSPKDWAESNFIDPKYTLKTQEKDYINAITISPVYLYKIPHSCCVNTYDLTCLLMYKFHEVGCERIMKYYYQMIELYLAWTLAFLNMFQLVLLVLSLYLLCMMFFDNDLKMGKSSTKWNFRIFKKENEYSDEDYECDDADDYKEIRNRERDQIYMTSYYL